MRHLGSFPSAPNNKSIQALGRNFYMRHLGSLPSAPNNQGIKALGRNFYMRHLGSLPKAPNNQSIQALGRSLDMYYLGSLPCASNTTNLLYHSAFNNFAPNSSGWLFSMTSSLARLNAMKSRMAWATPLTSCSSGSTPGSR